MSSKDNEQVFLFDNSDPEMQQAYENARSTFRYFWREIAWERRRIIPALDLACVKLPFSDGAARDPKDESPSVEHMWISDVDFDGQYLRGVLINSPNWLKTVKVGDPAQAPLEQITDWMFALNGVVYGAFTVNLMRERMPPEELTAHDAAWGLDFGDPQRVRLTYYRKSDEREPHYFDEGTDLGEHPMSIAMAPSLAEQLQENPEMIYSADERGWTFLHHEALAGNPSTVKVLLDAGADPAAKTGDGLSAIDLARTFKWEEVVDMLTRAQS